MEGRERKEGDSGPSEVFGGGCIDFADSVRKSNESRNRSYGEKRTETSETKISSVTLDGLSLNGGIDEPERVEEEEIFMWNPREVESIDDGSPFMRAESVRSVSPLSADFLPPHPLGQRNDFISRGVWEHYSGLHADSQEFVPHGYQPQSSTSQGHDDHTNISALHRSLSMPASREKAREAEQKNSGPRADSSVDFDQNVWLMSAAERALAASGSGNSRTRSSSDRNVSLHSQVNGRTLKQHANEASSHYNAMPTERGLNDAYGRAQSYAPGASSAAEAAINAFMPLPHMPYSIGSDSFAPDGWGQRSGPVDSRERTMAPGRSTQFRSFGMENPAFHPSPTGGRQAAPIRGGVHFPDFAENGQEQISSANAFTLGMHRMSPFSFYCEKSTDGRRLFLNSAPLDTDVGSLRIFFESFGTLMDYVVCQGRDSMLQITAAFAEPRQANAARNFLNSYAVVGRPLDLNGIMADANSRQNSTSSDINWSNSEYSVQNQNGLGTSVVMKFNSPQAAGKVRRNFGGRGHGKSVEFFDVAEAERALRMLNRSGSSAESVKVGFKGPNPMDQPVQPVVSFASTVARARSEPPTLPHSASEPPPLRVDGTATGGLGQVSPHSMPVMIPNTSPMPPPSVAPKFQLNIERVLAGDETRTALMIRNIPNKYNQKMMLQTLETNHRGNFDFFYLPIDFKNKCNVGYAFINFRTPLKIVAFFEEFHGRKWGKFNSEKVCEITYARIHGKANLIAHFQNSSLMNEDPKCRPIIFGEFGEQEEFPVGPRVRTRRGPSARETKLETIPQVPAAFVVGGQAGNVGMAHFPPGNLSPSAGHLGVPHQHPSSPGPLLLHEPVQNGDYNIR